MGSAPFDVTNTKGHDEDTVLFAKWNSFSRVAVYDRSHGDWSLSSLYKGEKPETRFMDIDSAASTPIVRFDGDLSKVEYLKYELTGLAFHMMKRSVAFTTLVIGPGGGRDLLTALVFGAGRVDGVEVNPIIANDVMLGQFRDFSGSIYAEPESQRRRRRRPQLHPAIERALRRHSGVARRHMGGDGRRRVHADREHAVHEGSVRGLLRPPDRARRADDYALGVRRPAARLARAGRVRKPRMLGRRSHGHRAAGSRRDVSAEEDGRSPPKTSSTCARRRTASASRCCTRRGRPTRATTTRSSCSRPIGRRSTTATITTSRRRPTTARSSFTRPKSRISSRPRSAAACSSATA